MAHQDAQFNDLLQIDQEDRDFQKKQSENREIEYSRDGSISFKPSGLRMLGGPSPNRLFESKSISTNKSKKQLMLSSRRDRVLSEKAASD